jgi:ABC-2 type transport system ATP-binding protein
MFEHTPVMIAIDKITKSYGGIQALKGVSFKVSEGEVLGLLGPNGAGKTTIMKILTCFTPPSSGSFTVGGVDGLEHPMEVQSLLGYMPENNPLYLEMTVRGFLIFIGRAKSLRGYALKNSVEQVIDQCGLENVINRIIKHLSKGYRQRVGLAKAILGDPSVLILDEPTIGLDPGQVVEMREKIKNMGKKHTIILSSHILPEVAQICDRVVIINRGLILAKDSPKTLIQQLTQQVDLRLEIDGEPQKVLNVLQQVRGVKSAVRGEGERRYRVEADQQDNVRAAIPRAVLENGLDLLEMRVNEMDLEDIFLSIVTHEEEAKKS